MSPPTLDRVLLGGACAALLGAVAWAAFAVPGESFTVTAARSGKVGDRPWELVAVAPVDTTVRDWSAPLAQPHGERWIFEVFTPPIIFFDTSVDPPVFTVEPPLPAAAHAAPPPFGLEVLAVERQLYRLQYQGVVGDLFMLDNLETGTGLNLREGQQSAEAGVTLLSGRVERRMITPDDPDQTPTVVNVATLVLRDDRTGERIELTSLAPRHNPRLQARVTAHGREQVVQDGDRLEGPGATFVIRRIDLDPSRVTVEKWTPGEDLVVRQLAPATAP